MPNISRRLPYSLDCLSNPKYELMEQTAWFTSSMFLALLSFLTAAIKLVNTLLQQYVRYGFTTAPVNSTPLV